LVVAHVELDQPERVSRPRFLDDRAVAPLHIVAPHIGLAFGHDLGLLDRVGHGPGRIGGEPEQRRAELRRLVLGIADDGAAHVGDLPVAQIASVAAAVLTSIRVAGGDPLEPAAALEIDGERARPVDRRRGAAPLRRALGLCVAAAIS
jgi:hypothetical protein